MSDTSALYHIVFCTHKRQMTIPDRHSTHLYKFLWEKLKEKNCHLYRINGIANHLHIFIDLHPTVALASLVAELKRSSSIWMKRSGMFPLFEGWGKEYYAHTLDKNGKDGLIEYIKNQRSHHQRIPFDDELRNFCAEIGIPCTVRD